MLFDVIGVGTNSVDEVLFLAEDAGAIASSGKTRVRERHILPGGQTATTVAACSALGLRSGYIGAFGSDSHGQLIRRALISNHVDVTNAIECEAPNRMAVVLVDSAGRRTVFWHRSELLKVSLSSVRTEFLKARVIHADDDDPALALHVSRMAREAGTPVTSDIEHESETVEQLISTVAYPIMAEDLPARLTGESDPERALRKLRRLNPGLLCVTLGARGAAVLDGDRFQVSPAFDVKALDTTGAGDVFRAGFIYGLLQRWDVSELLRFANAAAALSCMRMGAMPSVPELEETQKLVAGGR